MNKNEVNSSKNVKITAFIALILFSIFAVIFLYELIVNTIKHGIVPFIVFGIILIIISVFIILSLILLNRGSCIITYDKKANKLYRRGFISGFKSEILISDIKEVEIISINRSHEFIVIKDTSKNTYNDMLNNSYFKVENTEDNMKFIRQFWFGPITENIPFKQD